MPKLSVVLISLGKIIILRGKLIILNLKGKNYLLYFTLVGGRRGGGGGGEFLKNMPLSGISTPSDPCFSEALYNGKLFPPHEIKLDINLVLTFA